MANKRSFVEMDDHDDPAIADPNVPQSTQSEASPVSILPLPSDDLETTVKKMQALADLVAKDKNIAAHPDFCKRDSIAANIARQAMKPTELMQYDAWAAGAAMPHFDWAANRSPALSGKRALLRNRDRAAAMDIIWAHEGATAANVAWLVENMDYVMPLLGAVVRVMRAERDLVGRGVLTKLEMAELQTINWAVRVSDNNLRREYEKYYQLEAEIEESMRVLERRATDLDAKLPCHLQDMF